MKLAISLGDRLLSFLRPIVRFTISFRLGFRAIFISLPSSESRVVRWKACEMVASRQCSIRALFPLFSSSFCSGEGSGRDFSLMRRVVIRRLSLQSHSRCTILTKIKTSLFL